MPTNKYATAYLNAAYARMAATIEAAQVPAFTLRPTPDQFELAKSHAEDIARAVDDYLYALVIEADSNSTTHISTKDSVSICGDALHDSSLLDDLQEAADTLREDARQPEWSAVS